uniref:RIMS-binding protein 2 n=1 Tax=Erpetoichthys calabaricus TaxID=27687 RepID=A0A8C4T2D6_ERPCA
MTLCNGVDLPDEKNMETNSGSASLTMDIKKDINTISEELCIQHKESPGISVKSEQDPTPSRPQSESKHVTPDSEFIPQSTPKSCTTSEVDTASEVEDLDFDVSPVPEPEMRVPAKLQVFIARYSYNPFKGPNKNPEAELPLTAGEYIYVYGEMDEDGFYEGELMDGRRGLVPSNFVERVSDDDVMSVHPPEVSDLSHNSYQESSFHSSSEKNLRLSVNSLEKNELCLLDEEITSVTGKEDSMMTNGFDLEAEEVGDDVVPYPRKLTLIKQLAKSIIISWEPPLVPAGWGNIWSYNVYVDKELRLNVPFGSQTKAVLGQLDVSLKAYRVSVQSISEKGNSDQLCCSVLVGRDVCVAPTQLKVGSVTATSACLSWLPSNSNFAHVVYLNEEEYEIVKAGNYSLCLTNLRPHMRYKVKVEARPNRTPWELSVHHRERKCACTAFETLMAGPPDAPLDVQVEPGPSPGIALVSWLPVTIDAAGTSNGVRVTGYVIYADTQKVLEVASPTAGSVLVGPSQIHILQASKELTVRTMSMYGESVDSVSVKIPSKLFAATAHCPPLQKFPSASNSSDICVHMVPPYRDSLETTAAKSSLLPSLPDATASSSVQTPDKFLNSNPSGEQAETYQEDQISMDFRTDSLINTSSEFNSVALHAEVQDLELEPMVGISSPKDRLLNPSKDCESSSSKYPTDSYSREADVSCSEDLSESLQAKNIRGLEQEEEEKGAKANARVVSIEEFLDDCEEKQEVTEQPGQTKNDFARPEKAKEVCLPDVPQPVCYPRLNEYHNDSSRGSDLSDILEEDEEELCSDTAGNEDDKDALCQANLGVSVKETMAKNDSRNLSGSLKRLSNELVPNTEHVDSRPYKEAQRTASTPDKPISSEVEDYPGESNVRIFVALFDYDPATMSLNPDAVEAELPFKDGQIIKVYGDKDADGFYRGESGGRFGYVPSNMVSEILAEDAETKEQVLRQGYLWPQGTSKNTGTRSHAQLPRRPVPPPKPRRSKKESFESHSGVPVATPRRMVAIFDYDPRESSPNIDVEAELTFSAGDIIEVFGEMDDDGFFYGSLSGLQGLVPSNFLQAIPEKEEVSEVISEEGKPQEGLRESQVSPDASKEKNDSAVSEDMPASNKQSNALVTLSEDLGCSGFTTGHTYPQALTPDSPSKDENSLQGKKKKGFFSKGKKLFKKFGSSKKD